jgi:invasion protein IalB
MKRLIFLFPLLLLPVSIIALAEPPASTSSSSKAKQVGPKVPENPRASVVGHFGDWVLACEGSSSDKAKPAPCVLVQRLVETTNKKTVFLLTLGYGPQGNIILTVHAPLGVDLAKGLEVSLGQGQAIHRAAFSACTPNGCQAELILSDDLQQEMRKNEQAVLTVYALDGKLLRAASSLKGLGDGLSALDKRKNPP